MNAINVGLEKLMKPSRVTIVMGISTIVIVMIEASRSLRRRFAQSQLMRAGMTEPRLMSGKDAAAYCGVTPETFSKWVADGRAPKPLPGSRRWDRKAIDLALDKASGILPAPISKEDQQDEEEQRWERAYEARKGAREQNPEYTRKKAAPAKVGK
jgi:predicted DNA-binding transcriptional regulator AlpA